ncbi:two-component system response regulator [Marinobacterium iners]|uniref:HD-GYP domain-containing protein n=1 Tax=Marinobacterium iners TaxID=48076 RepID=UPI001A8E8CEB|nr:HD domain-containing phosphohydrolase [Marinobacterium iners]QSR34604.1 two-component system response regulator [Marinobacterium iners]
MTNSWQLSPHQASILIIDDESANLKLLQKMLRSLGYDQLHLIQDPREALSAFNLFQPHLVLLDLNMPHLNGFDVLKQFAESETTLKPPVIVLTAHSDRDTRLKALNEGARDFIGKPFDLAELQVRVRNLLDAHMAHRLVHDQKTVLDQLVDQRTEELRRTRLEAINRLGLAAGYRDNETGEHITRVSLYCRLIARQLGWNSHDCELIHDAAPMHDIGKIGIPDEVLLKPGKLTDSEFETIKLHPQIGADLLRGDESDLMQMAHSIALTHHEKWDGTGYPQGLKGEDIPLEGRIVAVADVFDAVTSDRPYKRAWSFDEATDYIRTNAGSHFDPQVVKCFLSVLGEVKQIYKTNQDAAQEACSAA